MLPRTLYSTTDRRTSHAGSFQALAYHWALLSATRNRARCFGSVHIAASYPGQEFLLAFAHRKRCQSPRRDYCRSCNLRHYRRTAKRGCVRAICVRRRCNLSVEVVSTSWARRANAPLSYMLTACRYQSLSGRSVQSSGRDRSILCSMAEQIFRWSGHFMGNGQAKGLLRYLNALWK